MQATVVLPGRWSYQLILCLFILPFGLFAHRVEAASEEYLFLGESPSLSVDLLVPAPAEGETVDIDAPGFNWLPEDGSRAFILEISRNQDFPESHDLLEKVRESGALIPPFGTSPPLIAKGKFSWLVAGLPLSLYHPSFQLGAGHWFWCWHCAFSD